MTKIYSWFKGFYGQNLFDYLSGKDCIGDINNPDLFWQIGLFLFIPFIAFLLFYFIPRSRWTNKLAWVTTLMVVLTIGFISGFSWSYSKDNVIPVYHKYGSENCTYPNADDDGSYDGDEFQSCDQLQVIDGASEKITFSSYLGFGFATLVIWLLFFLILSGLFKRWSKWCTHTPWQSKWPKTIYKGN